MPKLVIHHGTAQAWEHQLRPGVNRVGRGPDNDLTINDGSVSTAHARFTVNGDLVSITDLGSTNGTFINHSQVAEGLLQPGQSVRLGNVEILWEADNITAVAAPPAPAIPSASPASASRDIPGMAEPPPGKTACKFHSNAAGQWLCARCSELFCSLCVATKRTAEGTGFFCRRCGTACVPVRVNFTPKNDNEVKVYSDGVLLARSLGFGFAAMMIAVGLWTGLAALTQSDVPFLFCIATGFLCGYAVKIAAQDNPGVVFSAIAAGFSLLGMVLGKLGMILVTHNTMLFAGGALVMISVFVGVVIGLFLAWKFGGGDF